MARTYRPTYDYNDHTLTPPTPGADLILQVGLVQSLAGIGPKTGGQYIGIPRVIGPLDTRLWRPHDQVEMTLPNTDLQLWNTPFVVAGHRQGVFDLVARPGWQWLRWTIADHVAHDHQRVAKADHGITPVYPNTHAEPLVIVPCGATKAAFPRVAGELYTGGYHRLTLRAAHALTTSTNIRIVSGLHGLLPPRPGHRPVRPATRPTRLDHRRSTRSAGQPAGTPWPPRRRHPRRTRLHPPRPTRSGRRPAPHWLALAESANNSTASPASPQEVRSPAIGPRAAACELRLHRIVGVSQ
ncbi:hypothetical protein E143388_07770 [Rhodococcus opacus]|nr:hypothetical protein E143388_07770 [Rhodococcus opacus]